MFLTVSLNSNSVWQADTCYNKYNLDSSINERMFHCDSIQSFNSSLAKSIGNGSSQNNQRHNSSCHNSTMDEVDASDNRILTPSRLKQNTTPFKTPTKYPRTPSKSRTPSKYVSAGDRFIPNRAAMDFDNGHFQLLLEGSNLDSPSKRDDENRFKENLNANTSNSKILSFKRKLPYCEGYSDQSKVLHTQNITTISYKKSKGRSISQVPEKILDAPDFVNDYYLNLLDWNSTSLLAVALAHNVYIWDSKAGTIIHLCELDSPNSYIASLKWDKSNGYLAVGTSNSTVQLWDVEKKKKLRQMSGHASRIASLSWNSFILSSGCRTGAIHHHDVRVADHQIGVLQGHSQEVCGLQWSPDGKHLASGGNDNVLNIWDSNYQQSISPLHSISQHTAGVKAIAWCPWQNSLLASGGGSADRCIKFWNVNTGLCLNSIDTESQVCGILWSEEYKELISGHGYSQNQLTVWKYPSMDKVIDLTGHTNRVLQLTMSPCETYVMSAGADETLRLWKVFPMNKTNKIKQEKNQDALSIFKFR